jgi:hypothetical protein
VASYCAGRVWIEMLRDDTAEHFFGIRLNVFTSIVVGLVAVGFLVALRGRPREVLHRRAPEQDDAAAEPAQDRGDDDESPGRPVAGGSAGASVPQGAPPPGET